MISISISSYNQAEFLRDAIESCLNQSLTRKLEIIVVDDGSTDNSLEIARSYEPRIKVISQVNKGLSSARNTGLMHATRDWFLPLDADDILLPECVEEIFCKTQETDADIIAPSFKTFGTSDQEVILMPNPTIEDFKTGNRIAYCAAVRKTALLEVGGYSPRMVQGWEDYHLWFNLLERGKTIVTIPEVLWHYRTKETSMWTESQKHSDELWAQIKKDFPDIFNEKN